MCQGCGRKGPPIVFVVCAGSRLPPDMCVCFGAGANGRLWVVCNFVFYFIALRPVLYSSETGDRCWQASSRLAYVAVALCFVRCVNFTKKARVL